MAINLKALIEKRNEKAAQLRGITEKAASEIRGLTEEEVSDFDGLEAQIRALDDTIERAKRDVPDMDPAPCADDDPAAGEGAGAAERRDVEEFAAFIRSESGEQRADVNLTQGANGAVVPASIANMIIKKVVDRAPIYAAATKFSVKGTLSIPYYDESAGTIEVAWHDEFSELESTSGKFASIDLASYLAGSLSKISRSLINNSDFDLVSFVVDDIADKIAGFIEAEIISSEKIKGLSGVKISVTAAAEGKVTSDELIDLKDSVKDAFQAGCFWVMSPATRTAIRKLKDSNGRYLLQDDLTSPFGSVLLGKPVHVSDAMPDMAAGARAIYYGDFTGLAVNTVESPEIQVLTEKYATQHAVGVVAWLAFDAKVMNAQKIAALDMKAASGAAAGE